MPGVGVRTAARLLTEVACRVFRSRYCWTMWLGALITSLLSVAAHCQYQNLLTLAELFLVGLITSAAKIRGGGLLPGIAAYGSNHAGFTVLLEVIFYQTLRVKAWCVFLVNVIFKYNFYGGEECIPPD